MSGLVPLLVGRFYRKDGCEVKLDDGLTPISNWMEFAEQFLSTPLNITLSPEGVETSQEELLNGAKEIRLSERHINTGVLALNHYFNNGGGACYLLSMGTEDNPADIAAQIQEYSELSLLAVIDSDAEKLVSINAQLDAFITDNPQSFLLASGASEGRYVNKEHVAVYTPDLRLKLTPQLYDEGILIPFTDDEKTIVKSMAELKVSQHVIDTQAYERINESLKKSEIHYDDVRDPVISPVAAVAGAYCATERSRGIWRSPANVSVIGALPVRAIGKSEHDELNQQGINAIIWQPNLGTRIIGARTQVESTTPTWRSVAVRLLFNSVERDIRNMLTPVAFEPNSAATWQSVTAAIKNYLHTLWKKGGLYGNTAESAFHVALAAQEGNDTDNGSMQVRVGLAALRPAEFIYLEFTQDVASAASA